MTQHVIGLASGNVLISFSEPIDVLEFTPVEAIHFADEVKAHAGRALGIVFHPANLNDLLDKGEKKR